MDKPPFGFRPDAEEKPEPPAEAKAQVEISNTSLHESKAWSPVASVPASPNDTKWRY